MRKIFAMGKTLFKGDLTESGAIILKPVPPKPCLDTVGEIAAGVVVKLLIFIAGVMVGAWLW